MLKSDSTYDDIINGCVKVLDVSGPSDRNLTLFRADGTIIPKTGFLTLKDYLTSMKKSAGQLKLGIGYGPKVHRFDYCTTYADISRK